MRKIILPKIDLAKASAEIENFIIERIISANKKGAVVGLSGGIDSTTTAYLAKRAFDRHNRSGGVQLSLMGLIMPSEANDKSDMEDGERVARTLGIEYRIIPVKSLVKSFQMVASDFIRNKYDEGNLSSETRAILLSRLAAANEVLILGTGNRDEDYCLGYFTKRGDGQVDISPIGDLSKRHVKKVAQYLGIDDRLINRVPTAGLWRGQTDEDELGFTYQEVETVIIGKDLGLTNDEIEEIVNFGNVRNDGEGKSKSRIVDRILEMHKKNKFKMEMPPVAKVTKY